MMELIIEILGQVFSFNSMLGLLIGTSAGMVIGILPGLSATMGVALLMPLTFSMGAIPGMIMLVSIYTSAIYGGSISAILLHTPGTASSAATAIDGYELTKQGRGLEAVGLSTVCSMIGGVFSGLVLLLVAPPLSRIALRFSEPEFFLLAIFGMTIIASLAGDSVVKGLLSGAFGLMISLIGTDIMTGFPRFTFGLTNMETGIALVPALIGLFSISQVLTNIETIYDKKKQEIGEIKGRLLPSREDFKSLIPTIAVSAVIGVFVGIMPGAGGDVANWVALNEAKRMSKNPEKFGKGSLAGVAAPETANNAVTGGALIPTLVLGIPGSSVAAVLLGGLMVQGLVPGRELFTTHGVITYSIIIGLILANILMGVLGLLSAKHLVKVTKVPAVILTPAIVLFSIVGSYAINNNIFDVYVMFVFGVIGYLMKKHGFHPAPVVLAMILGPLAEGGLRRTMVMARGPVIPYLFGRPISVALMILIVVGIASPYIMERRRKNKVVDNPDS